MPLGGAPIRSKINNESELYSDLRGGVRAVPLKYHAVQVPPACSPGPFAVCSGGQGHLGPRSTSNSSAQMFIHPPDGPCEYTNHVRRTLTETGAPTTGSCTIVS